MAEQKNSAMAWSSISLINTQQVQIPVSSTNFAEQIQTQFYSHFRLIPKSCKASDRTKVDFTILVRIGNLKEPFFFNGKQNKTNKNHDIQKTYLLNRRMYYLYFIPTNLFRGSLKYWKQVPPLHHNKSVSI